MKAVVLVLMLSLAGFSSTAQYQHDVKVGTGASFLGTGDMLIGKLEAEATRRWNRTMSHSLALGVGYGDSEWLLSTFHQRTFTTHLDGNIFISPFGNDRRYNLKLGTGASLMYVSDSYPRPYDVSRQEKRMSLGFSVILEHEFALAGNYLVGLKMMTQPYLNGDIAHTLLLKFGRKFPPR